ncbi:MAG TPA: 2'-5' RNA ligase family protein [Patescibacteria group bacterium]|nr:2'-5' RNA ligase family protein [Patescibacteria group bacterium]
MTEKNWPENKNDSTPAHEQIEKNKPITEYVSNVDNWENWEKEYRYGLILIMPPEPVLSLVNSLRSKYDPKSQASCDTHISISVPVPKPLTEEDWQELQNIASEIKPFEINYGKPKDYPPYPGVAFPLENQTELNAVREKIESASLFSEAVPRRFPFNPHMTIAEFISKEETADLLKELEDKTSAGEFLCDGLVYIVPDESMHFNVIRKLNFGQKK